MKEKLPISVLILTFNEEANLYHALKSVTDWAKEVWVIDSHSTDKTLEIARSFGTKTVEHNFTNQADQLNWALQNLEFQGSWILRLDADEYMLPELWEEIAKEIPKTPADVTGFYMKRRVYFMGRWIKHGGYYPTWILRLWRKGAAKIEEREMDEHAILTEGHAEYLENDFVDNNKKNLESWITKHNNFSTREARARMREEKESEISSNLSGSQAEKKRWVKNNFYAKLPLFFRSLAYFVYRYFFRLGFLDGREGLIFHVLQGFWHQFVIDAKIYEEQKKKHQ